MKKTFLFSALLFGSASALAVGPTVSNVTIDQSKGPHKVKIAYTLSGAPAVVTVEIFRDGVAIDPKLFQSVTGDAFVAVKPGDREAVWDARRDWPDQDIKSGVTAVVTAWPTNDPPTYMVVSLTDRKDVKFYVDEAHLPGGEGVSNRIYKTTKLLMRRIPAAGVTWRRGSLTTERGRGTNETAQEVMLASDFYLGVYEVTGPQYNAMTSGSAITPDSSIVPKNRIAYDTIRGTEFSWPGDGHKVAGTSFFGKLRDFAGGGDFDFPGEAEWEFACRAGTTKALYTDTNLADEYGDANLSKIASYLKHDGGEAGHWTSVDVGKWLPNGFGLYDMSGNSSEWCREWYAVDNTDPEILEKGPATGDKRVHRGGNVGSNAQACRSASRASCSPSDAGQVTIGFRVWCSAVAPAIR